MKRALFPVLLLPFLLLAGCGGSSDDSNGGSNELTATFSASSTDLNADVTPLAADRGETGRVGEFFSVQVSTTGNPGRNLFVRFPDDAAAGDTFDLTSTTDGLVSYSETNDDNTTFRAWVSNSGTLRVVAYSPTDLTATVEFDSVTMTPQAAPGSTPLATGTFRLNGRLRGTNTLQ